MPPYELTPPQASGRSVLTATVVALLVAAVVLVTTVLPAEYGIDPTGVGQKIGLTVLANPAKPSTVIPTQPAVTPQVKPTVDKRSTPFRSDEMSLTLQPRKGAEIKAAMEAGDQFVFSWTADGNVNFDMHGEEPNAGDKFTSYWKGTQQRSGHGSFVAPFLGSHGWYWSNKGDQPVTITVKTSGFYEKLYKP